MIVDRLQVQLGVDLGEYERKMARSLAVFDRTESRLERQMSGLQKRLGAGFGRIGGNLGAGLAAGVSLAALQNIADGATRVQNALKVAGLEGETLKSTYADLFAIAQRQGAPLEAVANLYGRLAQSQRDLNATAPELLRFTEGVGAALRVQGVDAAAASGALTQLAQALGGGVVRAEEFNSVNEQARPILQAVALGLKEAGGNVSTLRQLVTDGKVSSEAFFRAFLAGLPAIERQAASSSETIAQKFTRVQNAVSNLFLEFDKASGFTGRLEKVFNDLSGDLGTLAGAAKTAGDFMRDLLDIYARYLAATDGAEPLKFSVPPGEPSKAPAVDPDRFARDPKPIEPVTLSSFKPPAGGGSNKGKGGGGDKKSDAEKDAEAVDNFVESLRKEKVELDAEVGALGKSNLEKRVAINLARGGAAATDAQREAIIGETTAIVAAEDATRRYAEAQQSLRDAMDEVKSTFVDTAKGLRDALDDGKIEGRELLDIVDSIVTRMGDRAIEGFADALFGSSGSNSSPGLLASLFSAAGSAAGVPGGNTSGYFGSSAGPAPLAFGGYRAKGGTIKGPGTSTSDSIIARVSDKEFIVRASEAEKHRPLLEAINDGKVPPFSAAKPARASGKPPSQQSSVPSPGGGPFASLYTILDRQLGEARAVAAGGMIRGPGTGTSDSILARVSNREFVVRAAAAEKHLPLLHAINDDRLPRFAAGGSVGRMPSVPQFKIPQVRMPAALPSSRAAQGPQNVRISVDVTGATGNTEVRGMVMEGVRAGIKAYDSTLDRNLHARVGRSDARYG